MSRGYSAVALYRPQRPENVGGVLRAAYAFGASTVILGTSTHPKPLMDLPADTPKAWRHMPVFAGEDLMRYWPIGATLVAVECVEGAADLSTFVHPEQAVYLFGPESGSLPKDLLDRAAVTVRVNTRVCLNLAMAVGIVLYDRSRGRPLDG